MPVDVPVLAARLGRDVVGLHPDEDDRGLGLLALELDALELGSPSRRPRRRRAGLGVDQLADLDVGGLDRGAGDVADDAHALASRSCGASLSPGSGPRSRSSTIGGQAEQAERAEQGVADQRAAADAGLLDAASRIAERSRRGPRREDERRVAVLDDLLVAHQLAWPTGSRRCRCSSSARPRVRPSATLEAPRPPMVSGSSPISERRSRRRTNSDRADGRRAPNSVATWRSARFAACGSTSVGRGWCGGEPGSAIGLVASTGVRPSCRARRGSSCVAHASSLLVTGRVRRDPDRDSRRRTPMPTSQANRPSVTGPRPPRAKPPESGWSSSVVEVGDDVALLLGRQVAVGEDRHVLRAGEHGLVDVLGGSTPRERRGVPAARQRAAGAGEVVAGRAVGAEELAAADDGLVALRVGSRCCTRLVGDRRAGAERGDVRRQRGDLLLGVDGLLARGLGAGLGQRHPAGADLEVDGGGTDADQRRAVAGCRRRCRRPRRSGRGRTRSRRGTARGPARPELVVAARSARPGAGENAA